MREENSPAGLSAVEGLAGSVVMSGKVGGIRPLSGVLISEVDTGKSESLMRFGSNEGVRVVNDVTSYGFIDNLVKDIKSGDLHHVIIPDLLKIRRRNPNVSKELISLLNTMAEEGLRGALTYNIQILTDEPLRCGFLTSITIDEYEKAKKGWSEIGFSSRIIPLFFGYAEEDLEKAREDVLYERNVFGKVSLPNVDSRSVEIEEERRKEVGKIAKFAGKVNEDYTAFRSIRQMVGLVKSHALREGREKVTGADVKFLRSLVPFWFDPIFGNDCCYYIIRELPSRSGELVESLSEGYSRATVHRHRKELNERGVIEKDDEGLWRTTY